MKYVSNTFLLKTTTSKWQYLSFCFGCPSLTKKIPRANSVIWAKTWLWREKKPSSDLTTLHIKNKENKNKKRFCFCHKHFENNTNQQGKTTEFTSYLIPSQGVSLNYSKKQSNTVKPPTQKQFRSRGNITPSPT